MALSLGRAASRLAGVAARRVLAASHAAKGGADIPIAGLRAHLPNAFPLLRPNGVGHVGHFSLARFSHTKAAPTLVMVVVHEDPDLARFYAESLSKAVREQIVVLDKVHHAAHPDDDSKLDLPEECPEKHPHVASFVVDGKLCEAGSEIKTLLNEKIKAAFSGNRDPFVSAVDQMGKNLDLALYRINWKQETLFEKLDARMVAQNVLLEDQQSSRSEGNFVDGFLSYLGRKLFPDKVIIASRHLTTLVPYGSKYYFYGLFAYGLLTADIPPSLADYAMIVFGAHWVAADEIKDKIIGYHKYDKEAVQKARDDAKKAAQKARDDAKKAAQKACDDAKKAESEKAREGQKKD